MHWHSSSLWLLILLISSALLELGCATAWTSHDVLAAINADSMSWWRRPAWLHALAALLYAVLLVGMTFKGVARRCAQRTQLLGGISAVLLASHLSPLYLIAPFVPLVGLLLGLIVIACLSRGGNLSGIRDAFLDLTTKARSYRLLWSVTGILILVAFYEQFQEMAKLVDSLTDFRMFYEAAVALGAGDNPYTINNGGYFHPPTFAFYFQSLTWLPITGASLLWFTIKLVLVIWSIRAVFRLVGGREPDVSNQRWLILGAILVAARFLLADLAYGNTNVLVLWLTLAAVSLDSEEKPCLAALALAGAASVKVVPILFVVYFLARRRLPVLMWMAVWLLALNLTPLLLGGGIMQEAWRSYLETGVAGKLNDSLAQLDNQSMWGALSRLSGWPLSLKRLAWGGLSLLLISTAAWATYNLRVRCRTDRYRQAGAASLFFLLGLLVSPGSWVVHYCALLLPMTYLLGKALKESARAPVLWAVFIVANVVFTISGWFRPSVRWSIEQSWFVIMTLVLFATMVGLTTRSQR